MMKFLRSQSQTVLVVVLGVIGLGFLFYGNSGNLLTTGAGHISNDYGRIDGQDLTVAELTDAIRETRNTLTIHGQSEELRQPKLVAEDAWRQLLLLREADKLHINVSDQDLIDRIKSMPDFQKNGTYSPEAYQNLMGQLKVVLRIPSDAGADPLANTSAIFQNILRDQMRTQAVGSALFSSVRSSAHDVTEQYQKLYGPATVTVVTFDPKAYIATAQVTPAEVEAEYKSHPENPDYRTKEKRNVDYVLFLLSPDQLKLPDAQKTVAKDALGQKALDFALAFQPEPSADGSATPPPPDFYAEAKKQGLTAVTTGFFTADTPPTGLPPSPAFNNAAFALTKDNTISKVVELDNGVAVLHLAEIQPSELRPLNEVQADIQKHLQQTKGTQEARTAAESTSGLLKAFGSKVGTDFKTTATSMKLNAETLPPFVPYTVSANDQRLRTIAYVAAGLKPGEISDPVPVQSDGSTIVVHLDSRGTADPAGLAAFETTFRQEEDEQLRQVVYVDWTEWKSKQPGTHKPPELEAYGSVE